MASSAQDKFSEYLDECRENRMAVDEFAQAAYQEYKSNAYIAGYLQSFVGGLISELPKKRRAEIREEFRKSAQKHLNAALVNTIKEAA